MELKSINQRSKKGDRYKPQKENDSLNGQIFPYIAHYLTTGDLIYPAHEGDDHISSLLEEIGRLDLVRKLFPNQKNTRNHSGARRTSGKGLPSNDCSTTLRIKTKDDRWVSRTLSRILRLPKNENSKSPPVYRPPPQHYKGVTIVVVRSSLQGNVQVRVHGPSTALKSLIPHELTVIGQTTHHHLNSHIMPSNSSAHSIVMNLEEQGFVVTVRLNEETENISNLLIIFFNRASKDSCSDSKTIEPAGIITDKKERMKERKKEKRKKERIKKQLKKIVIKKYGRHLTSSRNNLYNGTAIKELLWGWEYPKYYNFM
ncbi:hypothetical protein Anas_04462 [Armadillidium nasatum]|uniref:Uncharacterized protein n=1 Tax=Armadillidium nasatum TaxID=96803 RepID=A0A5N5TJZ5_9CRUS|nr:hypothetical protein Anas_04462 [Armadillidium nasatum]